MTINYKSINRVLLLRVFISIIIITFAIPSLEVEAQEDNYIGILSSTGATYACASVFNDKSNVSVTTKSGKRKVISKKKARKKLLKFQKVIAAKIRGLKISRKERKLELKALLNNPLTLLSAKKLARIQFLRDSIKNIKVRIAILHGDQDAARAISKQVKDCDNVLDVGNGSNIILSQSGATPVHHDGYYMISAAHIFPFKFFALPGEAGNSVCYNINGVVGKTLVRTSVRYTLQDKDPGHNPLLNGPDFYDYFVIPGNPPNTGMILLGGGVGYFRNDTFKDDEAKANSAATKSVTVYAVGKDGSC